MLIASHSVLAAWVYEEAAPSEKQVYTDMLCLPK